MKLNLDDIPKVSKGEWLVVGVIILSLALGFMGLIQLVFILVEG